jgi:hypothetical protein
MKLMQQFNCIIFIFHSVKNLSRYYAGHVQACTRSWLQMAYILPFLNFVSETPHCNRYAIKWTRVHPLELVQCV